MQLEGYGLAVGNNADMVVLQAHDPIEAIRLRARRLFVIRRGKVIAENAAEDDGAVASRSPRLARPRGLCALARLMEPICRVGGGKRAHPSTVSQRRLLAGIAADG